MDVFTLLTLLFLAFAAGYLTHWVRTWSMRRRLKEVERTLAEIDQRLLPMRQGRRRR